MFQLFTILDKRYNYAKSLIKALTKSKQNFNYSNTTIIILIILLYNCY